MTREEGKEFANALKNNYTIDFDKIPDFCDLVISALEKNEGAGEWYKLLCEKWDSTIKGDLISRQAVINAIANTCFWLSADNWEELTKCINSIPSVENKGEWTPVTERLPKNNEIVLCSAISTSISGGITRFVGCCNNGFWFVQTDAETLSYPRQYEVIAWQPLPEPYKAEKGGE